MLREPGGEAEGRGTNPGDPGRLPGEGGISAGSCKTNEGSHLWPVSLGLLKRELLSIRLPNPPHHFPNALGDPSVEKGKAGFFFIFQLRKVPSAKTGQYSVDAKPNSSSMKKRSRILLRQVGGCLLRAFATHPETDQPQSRGELGLPCTWF